MDNQYRGRKGQRKEKPKGSREERKPRQRKAQKGRGNQKSPISGFSTLSQVSGAPLRHPYRSSIPVLPPRVVIEPGIDCAICGEKIETIADCFSVDGGYAHFDCVLDSIRKNEKLGDDEILSYLGSGSFGICRKDEEGKYTIVKRIEIEKKENTNAFKSYVESLKE